MIQQALNQALSTGLAGAYIYSQTPNYKTRVELKEAQKAASLGIPGEEIPEGSPLADQISRAELHEAELKLRQNPKSEEAQEAYRQAWYGREEFMGADEPDPRKQAAASEQAALDRYYSRANGQMVQAQSLQERLALLRESAKKGAK